MELLIFVALWCGTPNSHVSQRNVNECRVELMKCLNEDMPFNRNKAIEGCASKTKIKDLRW